VHDDHVSLDVIRRYFSGDAFAEYCGIKITEIRPGCSKVKMPVQAHHLNSLGMVHGGAVFTLADMAFASAVHSRGRQAVAINTTISFVKAAKTDTLYAEAKETSRNQKIATYDVRVTDASGDVVALFQGMAYIKKGLVSENREQQAGE
jgi:acyl-CoA thioesterase